MSRKPASAIDWDLWATGEVQLHEAVALSCGIDPKTLLVVDDGMTTPNVYPPAGSSVEFSPRLAEARRWVGRHLLPSTGRLVEFGAWALDRRWDLPAEFPRASTAPPSLVETEPSASKEKPIITRERKSLLVIIGVLAHKSGMNIDKTNRSAKEIQRIARVQFGVRISVSNIAGHLRKVDEAIDRSKIEDD